MNELDKILPALQNVLIRLIQSYSWGEKSLSLPNPPTDPENQETEVATRRI
jgi:hypothetical protein